MSQVALDAVEKTLRTRRPGARLQKDLADNKISPFILTFMLCTSRFENAYRNVYSHTKMP